MKLWGVAENDPVTWLVNLKKENDQKYSFIAWYFLYKIEKNNDEKVKKAQHKILSQHQIPVAPIKPMTNGMPCMKMQLLESSKKENKNAE